MTAEELFKLLQKEIEAGHGNYKVFDEKYDEIVEYFIWAESGSIVLS